MLKFLKQPILAIITCLGLNFVEINSLRKKRVLKQNFQDELQTKIFEIIEQCNDDNDIKENKTILNKYLNMHNERDVIAKSNEDELKWHYLRLQATILAISTLIYNLLK